MRCFFVGSHFPAALRAATVPALLGAAVLLGGATQTAHAQNLLSGQTITPTATFSNTSGYTLLTQQSVNGGGVVDDLILNFTARSAVYRENSTGNLAFLYQVTNLGSSNDSVGRFTVGQFDPSFTTSIAASSVDADGAGVFIAGSRAADQADRSFSGTPVGFNFLPSATAAKLLPGQSSQIMAIYTNAKEYKTGQFSVIDGTAYTVQGYAPKTPGQAIPEPGTLALLAPALLGGVAVVARRRRK